MLQQRILYQSPAAATHSTRSVTGWWNANGHYFGNDGRAEHAARLSMATHSACEFGHGHYPIHSVCPKCRAAQLDADWRHMPRRDWDLESPVAVHGHRVVLLTPEEVTRYAEGMRLPLAALHLVWCAPVYPTPISMADVYPHLLDNSLPVPDALAAAFSRFNEAIAACGPVSWRPTFEAALIPESLLMGAPGNPVSSDLLAA